MGRGVACDFSRGSLVTSQFVSLVTSRFFVVAKCRTGALSGFVIPRHLTVAGLCSL